MKFLLFTSGILITIFSYGQIIERPKASIELKFYLEDGKNGSAVTFDPDRELYYSVIAGNAGFPMEVFDKNGLQLYQTEVGSDLRGLWWNKKKGRLEGNGYSEIGIVAINLNDQGYPSVGITTVIEGMHQPESNSCGAFDEKKIIYYYDDKKFHSYSSKNGKMLNSVDVKLNNANWENINGTSIIYTGVKKMELGLLDFIDNKVFLFDKKTGELTGTINLPSEAPTYHSFRFAYANKHVFIFNDLKKKWQGYQIFE